MSGSGISWVYASLHLAPDRQPCQHPTTQFFTGWMPFLPLNQQWQYTEGINDLVNKHQKNKSATVSSSGAADLLSSHKS